MNNEEPPFKEVLDEFRKLIARNFTMELDDIERTSRSLQFTIDGIKFDVLPATNMRPHGSKRIFRPQSEKMFQKIKRSPDPYKTSMENSAAMSEAAVAFVMKQSTFVHQMARLGKYWNSTIQHSGYISGRSYIMELLAIKAAKEEEANNYHPSMTRALQNFLEKIEGIEDQEIVFHETRGKPPYYKKCDVPSDIRCQKPLLLDVSNPWNNLMSRFKKSDRDKFSRCASVTLQRLKKAEVQGGHPNFELLFLEQSTA